MCVGEGVYHLYISSTCGGGVGGGASSVYLQYMWWGVRERVYHLYISSIVNQAAQEGTSEEVRLGWDGPQFYKNVTRHK